MHKIILIFHIFVSATFAWNPLLQHGDLSNIIFEDVKLRNLADSLGLNWGDLCDEFNEPSNTGSGTGFTSFGTWENFKSNWSARSDLAQALKDLLHYIEDSSVPVNHTPGGNCFNNSNSGSADVWERIIEYVPLCNGWDCFAYLSLLPIQMGISYELTNVSRLRRDFSGQNLYNERIYQNQLSLNTASDFITYYNNLLALHKQRVESEACSFKSYAEGGGPDPRDYMARGYSEAVSLGREIVRIFLYCRLHPEAWDNPPIEKKPDLTPVLNLLLDD